MPSGNKVAPSNDTVMPPHSSSDPISSKVTPSGDFEINNNGLAMINEDQNTEKNAERLAEMGGVHGLAAKLKVSISTGLTQEEASTNYATRSKHFGENKFPEPPSNSFWALFLESFEDTTIRILILASIASLFTGIYEDPKYGWVEGITIIIAIIAVALVTATNNYTKEKQFRALSAKNDDLRIKVKRAGAHNQVSITEIQVGDVVVLDQGDKIPADCVLIQGTDVKCNESSLTGEPEDIEKKVGGDSFLLSGCIMSSGNCECLVIAVGPESRWGKIRSKLVVEQEATPLMEKLDDMAKQIGFFGAGAAIATMIALLIIWFVSDSKPYGGNIVGYLVNTFIIGVTIVVVAIPEGLPLAVTISLSYSTGKMLQDNNLIRVLSACETMGNVTSICSDKTGTLTENRMTVVRAWIAGQRYTTDQLNQNIDLSDPIKTLLSIGICVNSKAHLRMAGDKIEVQGNKTEGALIQMVNRFGYDYRQLREDNCHEDRGDRVFTFNSVNKSMSTVLIKPDGGHRVYCKGAAEIIVRQCNRHSSTDGSECALTEDKRTLLENEILDMAHGALRTIALAHRDYPPGVLPADLSTLEVAPTDDLICDAICGIMDPLRPDVSDAVAACRKAGIMVRMVTGDNIHTACAIAKECGILTENGIALEGPKFRTMSDEELSAVVTRLQVLARSSPDDKHLLVSKLRERMEVVGVTGDGSNDAPALRVADVGLSMGIAGTELAKEASDIIIMDDRFASIKQAVLWGRSVYDNIRKFLQFQLTVNIVALALTFISSVASFEPPLNAVMMLWVNLIMDTMGALALGTEVPTPDLLKRRPYKRNAKLISGHMARNILVQSSYQLGLLLFLLFHGPKFLNTRTGNVCVSYYHIKLSKYPDGPFANCTTVAGNICLNATSCIFYDDLHADTLDYPQDCVNSYCDTYDYTHFTIIFNVFVLCQLFNEFNARSVGNDWNVFKGTANNKIFLYIITTTFFVQLFIVEVGGRFIKTTPLSIGNWGVCILLAMITVPLGILMRFIPTKESSSDFANPNGIQVT